MGYVCVCVAGGDEANSLDIFLTHFQELMPHLFPKTAEFWEIPDPSFHSTHIQERVT